MTSWSSAPIFQWENHCTCTLELPWFICKSTGIHIGTPKYYEGSKPHCLFFNPFSVPVTYIYIYIYICVCVCVTGCTDRYARWIGGLSHQSSDLSCLYNPLWKVVIHASLDTGFKEIQVVTYLMNCQRTKITLTKVFPKSLGAYTWINKVDSSSWIYSFSMTDTNIAKVEGWWLDNGPNHSVPDTQTTAPEARASSPYILPSPSSMSDHCDII